MTADQKKALIALGALAVLGSVAAIVLSPKKAAAQSPQGAQGGTTPSRRAGSTYTVTANTSGNINAKVGDALVVAGIPPIAFLGKDGFYVQGYSITPVYGSPTRFTMDEPGVTTVIWNAGNWGPAGQVTVSVS